MASFIFFWKWDEIPKHQKECDLGKRTPEEKQNFRQSVEEGSGRRNQMNSALLLSTWASSWSCEFLASSLESCAHFHFKGKHTRIPGVPSERSEWWAPGYMFTNNSEPKHLRPHFSHPQLQITYWPTHHAIPPWHCHSHSLGNVFQDWLA